MEPAVPDTTSPATNTAGPTSIDDPGPYRSHNRPATTQATTLAARNARNGHEYSAPPCRSATIRGMAVLTPMSSNAAKVTSATMPMVGPRRSGANSALRRTCAVVVTG